MSDYSSVDCDRQATAQAGVITCPETEIDRLKLQVKRLAKEAALDPDCSACLAGVCSQHQPLLGQLDVYKRREYRWRKWANKISNYISKAAPDGMLWNDEGGLADQLDDLLCGG